MVIYYDEIGDRVKFGLEQASTIKNALNDYEERLRELEAINSDNETITLKYNQTSTTISRREFKKTLVAEVNKAEQALRDLGVNI